MKFRLPKYFRKFLLKMGILMLIFTLCRILFFSRNVEQFPDAGINEFLVGLWFDWITLSLLFMPLVAIELFPNKNRERVWFKWTIVSVTFITYFSGILINLIDVEYFAYTSSRSNASLLTMLGFGNDLNQQLPSFFTDYWYLLLLFIALMTGGLLILKKIYKKNDDSADTKIWKQISIYLVMIFFSFFIGRGGFVSKPIRTTEASKYTESENAQLVLNSAFTVLNSLGASTIEEINYFEDDELTQHYSPTHQYNQSGRLKGQNVVILILESFTIEYIKSLNGNETGSTPFFDELVDSSLVFTSAFANGKKSIDAVPSIISSVPKLMKDEFLLTPYSSNRLESLPQILKEEGYQSAFFHGATNGSMNFDAYCAHVDFDEYYGRSEYDNEAHYDGTWGIYDEEFMQWSLDRFSQLKEPFFTTLFTISSHPPYKIPERYEEEFKDSESEVHKAIRYTDMALRKFFDKASKQDWYDNTLFVLTADHTSNSAEEIYSNQRGKLKVPLIMFHPNDTFFRGTNDRVIGHIDIMPTILDLLGYSSNFFAFGHSAFDTLVPGYTFTEVADETMLFEGTAESQHLLIFQNNEARALYELHDVYLSSNLISTNPVITDQLRNRIKAIIQTYNQTLIRNTLTYERYTN